LVHIDQGRVRHHRSEPVHDRDGRYLHRPSRRDVLVTARWGQEITANGSAPTNPQTDMKMNSLGKVVYYTARLGQITVTGEHLRKSIGTNILSDLLDPFVPTFSSEGLEINRRTRLSIE
jgi:hypothetical protein